MTEAEYLLVLTTLPIEADHAAIAAALVSERLAACVTVLGEVDSTYVWDGRLERGRERQMVIKTTKARWPALLERLGRLHPYEVPEIIAVPVAGGLPAYLRWVSGATI